MLKLYACHHCGYNETYEIIVNSLRDVRAHTNPTTNPTDLTHIGFEADLTLSNQYSETRLNNIFISTSSLTFEKQSDGYESFSFVKIGL